MVVSLEGVVAAIVALAALISFVVRTDLRARRIEKQLVPIMRQHRSVLRAHSYRLRAHTTRMNDQEDRLDDHGVRLRELEEHRAFDGGNPATGTG